MPKTAIEAMLERESAVVLAALVLLILLAWYAVLAGAGTGMDPVFMSGLWLSSRTSTGSPALTVTSPLGLVNSPMGIWPSDL